MNLTLFAIRLPRRLSLLRLTIIRAFHSFKDEYTKCRKEDNRKITLKRNLNHLETLVSDACGYSFEELKENKKRQYREYVIPRQVHIALIRLAFGFTLHKAAKVYNKDHTTVDNCIKATNKLLETSNMFRHQYRQVFEFAVSLNPDLKKILYLEWL